MIYNFYGQGGMMVNSVVNYLNGHGYKQLYKILANFDKLCYRLMNLEKKEFLRDFIESVEIYPEKMDNGRMLKQINFNFPVYYDGEVGKEIRLFNENTVETVCLLSKLNEAKYHVNVTFDMDELDLTSAESKATYEKIKTYVKEKAIRETLQHFGMEQSLEEGFHYEGMQYGRIFVV